MDDQHDKRKQQQHMILREFISSEQSYCASLKQIVDVYMHELRTPSTLERLGMSEDVLPVLFANVETVLHAHTQLAETWAKLSQVAIECKWGVKHLLFDGFFKVLACFKGYAMVFNGHVSRSFQTVTWRLLVVLP